MKKSIYIAIGLVLSVFATNAQTITVIAGNGTSGYSGDSGAATAAKMNLAAPGLVDGDGGIAADGAGNIYIADAGNNVIRKVTATGVISTFAGEGIGGYSGDNGPATMAKLNSPWGVTADAAGNVYIADYANNVIRKVNTSGNITTIAGGGTLTGGGVPATSALLNLPTATAIDASGNIYIAEGQVIRKVNPAGIITTSTHGVNVEKWKRRRWWH